MCYLGLGRTAAPAAPALRHPPAAPGLLGAYASTLVLTLTNPATILSFVAVFAGLGLAGGEGGYLAASVLVGGVFLGSALWWLILSGTVRGCSGPGSSRGPCVGLTCSRG